jgi:hypothetical protein
MSRNRRYQDGGDRGYGNRNDNSCCCCGCCSKDWFMMAFVMALVLIVVFQLSVSPKFTGIILDEMITN